MREGGDKETLPYGNAESQTNVERMIDQHITIWQLL